MCGRKKWEKLSLSVSILRRKTGTPSCDQLYLEAFSPLTEMQDRKSTCSHTAVAPETTAVQEQKGWAYLVPSCKNTAGCKCCVPSEGTTQPTSGNALARACFPTVRSPSTNHTRVMSYWDREVDPSGQQGKGGFPKSVFQWSCIHRQNAFVGGPPVMSPAIFHAERLRNSQKPITDLDFRSSTQQLLNQVQ